MCMLTSRASFFPPPKQNVSCCLYLLMHMISQPFEGFHPLHRSYEARWVPGSCPSLGRPLSRAFGTDESFYLDSEENREIILIRVNRIYYKFFISNTLVDIYPDGHTLCCSILFSVKLMNY